MQFPFAWKIAIATSALALLSTGGSVFYIYNEARSLTLRMMGARLKDIGGTGAYLFTAADRAALAELRRNVEAAYPDDTEQRGALISAADEEGSVEVLESAQSERLMERPDFQRIVELLRMVRQGTTREIEPLEPMQTLHDLRKEAEARFGAGAVPEGVLPTIAYTYLYFPAPGFEDSGEYLIYLADGDYLPYDWEGDGSLDGDADYSGNPIGNLVPAPNPQMSRAFLTGEPQATPDWTQDAWGVWVAGFIPLKDEQGRVIAVLGMDYDVHGDANQVAFIFRVAVAVVITAFFLAIGLAILMARYLDRPLRRLREGAKRVAQRDFSARIDIKNRDEMGLLANTFNEMVGELGRYTQYMQDLNRAFERFVPREFLQHMGIENILNVRLGDQVQREMTVLFSDIRAFTTLSESMTPKENFDFLNGYLGRVSPLIRSHHGFVDKFIGDAIMALFPRSVDDAVQNSIAMLETVEDYNGKRNRHGYPSIRIGIGLHTGKLMLGTIGEEQRMDGTVISDAVNTASRLESLTKEFGARILISEYSLSRLERPGELQTRCLGRVMVKGKVDPVSVHEIFNGDPPEVADHKVATADRFAEALACYESGDMAAAGRLFQELLGRNPEDRAAAAYVQRVAAGAK